MSKRFLLVLLSLLLASAVSAKTALDLLLEGRFSEAKAILDTSNVSPRYQILYYAMIESDAARACSLYQVVCIRYPNSDCDSLARLRLDQAQDMGFVVVPIAEWSQAPQEARPLALHRGQSRGTEVAIQASAPVEPPVVTPPVAPPVPVVVPPPPVSVSTPAPPPVTEPETVEEEEPVSVRDTLISSKAVPEVAAPAVVDTITPPPPHASREVISTPAEAQPTVPPVPQSEPVTVIEHPVVSLPPADSALHQVESVPAVEKMETAAEAAPETAGNSVSNHHVSNGSWYIQVGAFGNFDNAHRLALALKNAGYPVKLVPRDSAKGKLLQVRVGGYATRDDLIPVATELKNKFSVPTAFVSE
jgi:cell division septation protein DedD